MPNFVAKHMHEVNKSQVFVDRKKNAKRGYTKHKQGRYQQDDRPFLWAAQGGQEEVGLFWTGADFKGFWRVQLKDEFLFEECGEFCRVVEEACSGNIF